MNLWIRTQDRQTLLPMGRIDVDYSSGRWCLYLYGFEVLIGYYDTKERAIEIIDEIQEKIKQQLIVKTNTILKPDALERLEKELKSKYSNDFIMQTPFYEITPINNSIIIYEMPQE